MIAVCLLTCGRVELTRRTVHAFEHWHRGIRDDLFCLHADGGPWGDSQIDNCDLAHDFGFVTIDRPDERVPQMASFRKLIEEAALKGAEFVLWLENDWESVAPIPTLEFLQATKKAHDVVTWRLFGKRRMKSKTERGLVRETQIGTDVPIDWQPSEFDGWEIGRAHWGGGGCIATLAHLESQFHRSRLKDVVTAKPDLVSMRPVKNTMWHVGEERTPGLR